MPYNPSTGVYVLPAVYLAVPGTVIVAVQHNTPLTDLQTAQNYERPIIAGGTGAGTAAGARTNLGVPAATATVTYAAPTVDHNVPRFAGIAGEVEGSSMAIADNGDVSVTSTDVGAAGPVLTLDHDSATPAVNDVVGTVRFTGEDDAGADEIYAEDRAVLLDATAANPDGKRVIRTVVAGTLADRLHVAAGAWMEGATGTDKGAGSINAAKLFEGGVRAVGAPYAVIEDQKASGTGGGDSTSGSWQTRTLNTEVRDVASLITLAANQFTPSVDGWVEWSAPAYEGSEHKTRLFNVTDTTVAGVGSSEQTLNSGQSQSRSFGGCAVVAGKAYRVEHQVGTSQGSTIGYGVPSNFAGTVEVYTRVLFWPTT